MNQFFLPLLNFIVWLITIVICLDCLWRVKGRLRSFVKWFTAFGALQATAELMALASVAGDMVPYVRLAAAICAAISLFDLYEIVKSLDNEKVD